MMIPTLQICRGKDGFAKKLNKRLIILNIKSITQTNLILVSKIGMSGF